MKLIVGQAERLRGYARLHLAPPKSCYARLLLIAMLCVSFWRPRRTDFLQFLDDNLQNHQSFYRLSIISTNNWQNQIKNLILLSSEKQGFSSVI